MYAFTCERIKAPLPPFAAYSRLRDPEPEEGLQRLVSHTAHARYGQMLRRYSLDCATAEEYRDSATWGHTAGSGAEDNRLLLLLRETACEIEIDRELDFRGIVASVRAWLANRRAQSLPQPSESELRQIIEKLLVIDALSDSLRDLSPEAMRAYDEAVERRDLF